MGHNTVFLFNFLEFHEVFRSLEMSLQNLVEKITRKAIKLVYKHETSKVYDQITKVIDLD